MREEAIQREGVTADQVIRQAQQAADSYLKGHRRLEKEAGGWPGPLWGVLGAVAASALWCLWLLVL